MEKKNTKIKQSANTVSIKLISYVVIVLFTIMCLLPFILIISASFSTETIINKEGFGLLPRGFTLSSYEWVFRYPKMIIGSYAVTIIMAVCGTALGLFLIAMTGYALQRKDFYFRNMLSFFIYFTTLFSAGMAPTFIWVSRYLHLKGSYMAVFLQLLMTPWLIILMKNFTKSVPFEITESGKIDGAGDFKIFISLIFPMLKPALATVGLFLALGYWNEWYQSSLYLGSAVTYKPLQYYLYNIINQANALKSSLAGANISITKLPSNTLKMATAVVATGPIVFLYPFVQKYFISGITVGAVKG
ncbi:carbohydrate ABC transporter permease [Anaerocolumna chitinilytica]|jgi:multiple sugar transport system permease protein/putative aldouronate transport system permease protein|uniref:ABC transporter permease n=1 Tax=Anaerocolumna chitinilytica TaxID=1727145 RepID=A0A7I8DNH1_9FIRM|nr:carbohydrate ABC transporter permease [Anaerocolumna chitinilytica]BCJ99958.1 ABC transporter permease [Anaerocolumna chitinilytica]